MVELLSHMPNHRGPDGNWDRLLHFAHNENQSPKPVVQAKKKINNAELTMQNALM